MARIGILGAGGMGNTHARHYRGLGTVDLAIFDVDTEKARRLSDVFEAELASSFDELLQSCDAIDVCLPTDLHTTFALQSISAKKPTFVEKPIAGTLAEAASVVLAADAGGVPVMVGQVVRYFPDFRRGHDMVVAGKVGKPAAARMRRGGGPPRAEWFLDHEKSGGVLIDLAVHDFDWLRWTLGEVTQVYSRSVGAQRGHGVDYALTTLSFESGAVAHVESTWMDPSGFRCTFEVCGSDGMIEFDSRNVASLRTHASGGSRSESLYAESDDPYRCQLRDFVEVVVGGGTPPVTALDGYAAVAISIAALESARTGRVVTPSRHP